MSTRLCTEPGCTAKHVAKGYCRKHYRAHGLDASHGKSYLRTADCAWCGATFSRMTASAKNMRSCSEECRRALGGQASRKAWPSCKVYIAPCAECRNGFASQRKRLCCSKECQRERHARMAGSRDKRCPECDTILTGLNMATYCAGCLALHKRDARKNAKHQRRARMKSLPYELVSATRVYNRDAWTCGICHCPVDSALTYPHPRSPSLDHVVPLARGGGHTMDNVQLAHMACNLAKRDSMPHEYTLTA